MRLFGFEITRADAAPVPIKPPTASVPSVKAVPNVPGNTPTLLPPYAGYGGWFNIIRESFSGAWQRNIDLSLPNVMQYSTLYACVTLIAQDIGKLSLDLYEKDSDDIWEKEENAAFSPVLRKPNHFQTRQKFIEHWMTSKLMHGNTYALKERDNRGGAKNGNVKQLYILDPQVTRVLIAPDGDVFYQLATNRLAGIDGLIGIELSEVTPNQNVIVVPASEIIHDVYTPLFHPLCGVSPITACGLSAVQGLAMQHNSIKFFNNGGHPGGILIAPTSISDVNAKLIKDYWETNFTGNNAGRIAVLGDNMKYEPLTISASDAQLINQFKYSDQNICTAFKVPPWMVGVGPMPPYTNIEAINLQYYTQCLQPHTEAIEALMDDGLGLLGPDQKLSVAFDLDDLLKMDTSTQYKTYGDGVKTGILAPNEARKKVGYGPVKGGDTPYMQQQNFSLEALDERDTGGDPFGRNKQVAAGPGAQGKPPAAANDDGEKPIAADKQLHTVEWLAGIKTAVTHARTH